MTVDAERIPARRGRPGHSLDSLLDTAVAVFNERGYEATSMDELATRLGVTKSAIYHHVPSKSHLLEQALDEALDRLSQTIDAARADTGAPAYDRLRTAVRGSVQILVEHLPAVTLLLRVRGNSEVEVEALRRRRELDDKLAGLVVAAVEEGALRDDIPADLASRLLFGMVNSLVEWVRPEGRYQPDDIADAITSLAFEGLRR
jgi:AcrR family transcriptional regulator